MFSGPFYKNLMLSLTNFYSLSSHILIYKRYYILWLYINLVALKAYNKLNKDLKTLNVKPEKLKKIIKTWVIDSR